MDNQTETGDVYLQLAIDTHNGVVCFSVAQLREMVLPFVKPSFGILSEEKNMRFYLSKLIEGILLLYQLVNNGILILLNILRKLLVIPTCFLLQIGHYKQNAFNKSVTGAFALSQFTENFLLDSADNRYIRSLDEDGTLGILAVGYSGFDTEYRQPELFFRTTIVTVEVLEPSG